MTNIKKPVIDKPAGASKKPQRIKPIKKTNWPLGFLLFLLIFIFGAGLGIYFMPQIIDRLPIVSTWVGDKSNVSLDQINQQITIQESRLDELSQQYARHEEHLNQLFPEQINVLATRLDALELTLSQSVNDASDEEIPTNIVDSSQSTRIDMLLSRMSQLEASFIPLSKNMIDSAAANKQLNELSQQFSSANDKIAALESRLLTVENFATKDNSGLLLAIKTAQLKRKIISGNSYVDELRALKEMIKKSTFSNHQLIIPLTDQLEEFSQSGLITPYQLQNTFNDLIPLLLTASNADSDTSWWQNTVASFNNMISVRKTDGGSYNDNGVDDLIRNIEIHLKNSDLKAALNSFDMMAQAEKMLLEKWKSQVVAWLNSQEAIETLEMIATENYLTPEKNVSFNEEAPQ